MAFSYTLGEAPGVKIIHLSGTLLEKTQAIPMLEEVSERMDEGDVSWVLSMTDLQYINSTGLNVLINILTKARKQGGEAVITAVPAKIKELLLITKLSMVFTVTENLDDALSKFQR